MNNTGTFISPGLQFQFLSVCHYITSIGRIFFENQLITFDQQNQHIVVLNVFFDYLNKSNNETQAKQLLLQKILKGTDLYGGRENDTLDIEYVEETYQYFIITSLFSHYGGISQYLARIINRSSNLTYQNIRNAILDDFFYKYNSSDYCSTKTRISTLTPGTVTKVFKDYIMPIFPNPDLRNTSILSADYIYALVGLKIARILEPNVQNLGFDFYIMLSHTSELMILENTDYLSALEVFSTPALFFYADKEKEKFKKLDLTALNETFWIEAYEMLFGFLNSSVQEARQEALNSSIYYQLQSEEKKLMNRTAIADKYLQMYCIYTGDPQSHIGIYKTNQGLFKYLYKRFCAMERMPDLNVKFEEQFNQVQKIYHVIQSQIIYQALKNGDVIDKMDSPNTIVQGAAIRPEPSYCPPRVVFCVPLQQVVNTDIIVIFSIENIKNKTQEFCALKQDDSALILLKSNGNEDLFRKELGIQLDTEFQKGPSALYLKDVNENSTAFIQKVADRETEKYFRRLYVTYYEETDGERVINVLKSFVPFYSCVHALKQGHVLETNIMCSLDLISLIPVLKGVVKLGTVLGNKIAYGSQRIFSATKSALKSCLTCSAEVQITFSHLLGSTGETLASKNLLKQAIREISHSTFHFLDPGVLLMYNIGRLGYSFLQKLFQSVTSNLKLFSYSDKFSAAKKFMLKVLDRREMNDFSDQTRLIPKQVNKHSLVRFFYPGGRQFFGPVCLKLFGKIAEIRKVASRLIRIAVVKTRIVEGSVYYRAMDPKSGELSAFDLKLDENDLLYPIFEEGVDKDTEDAEMDTFIQGFEIHEFEDQVEDDVREYTLSVHEPSETDNLAGNEDLKRRLSDSKNPDNFDTEEKKGDSVPNKIAKKEGTDSDLPSTSKEARREYDLRMQGTYKEVKKPEIYTADDAARYVASKTDYNEQALREQLGQYALSSLKHHPFIPTYYQFAQDIVSSSSIMKPYDIWKLKNPMEVNSILQFSRLSDMNKFNLKWEKHMIYSKYGSSCEEMFDLPIDLVYEKYWTGQSFFDLYGLMVFRKHGILSEKLNTEVTRQLRITLDKLSLQQTENSLLKEPVKLWFSEMKHQAVVDRVLKKSVGKKFFFNDVILTQRGDDLPVQNVEKNALIQVLYLMEVSPHSAFDLTPIHPDFKDEFIIFPDVSFNVGKATFSEKDNLLTLHLMEEIVTRDESRINRILDLDSLLTKRGNSPRLESVREAAKIMSSNLPLLRLEKSEKILKSYVLEITPSSSLVPSYKDLANDLSDNLKIPTNTYDAYKINNFNLLDDVLFGDSLDKLSELYEAKRKIDQLYGGMQWMNTADVFFSYRQTPGVRETFRFEDYYVMKSLFDHQLAMDQKVFRRNQAAIYRLAIKQFDEFSTGEAIKLYCYQEISPEIYNTYLSYKKKDTFFFDRFQTSFDKETIISDFLKIRIDSPEKKVIFRIQLKTQNGVVNLKHYFQHEDQPRVILPRKEFTIDDIKVEKIHEKETLVVEMHETDILKEIELINIIKQFEALLQTDTTFYIMTEK